MDTIEKFVSKKRELRSKSNDGDAPKKLREDQANLSAISDVSFSNDNVFEGGLDSSTCKDILFECLKDLNNQMKELRSIFLESKESQIKGAEQLSTLTGSIKFINERFDQYEEERKEKDKFIEELKKENSNLTEHVKDLEQKVDRQEQYSRRNCLLIHGIKEEKDENTDDVVIKFIQDGLQEEINIEDLDRTHRIGKVNNGKSRPIIVKFARYNVRKKVFHNKRKLKGKNMSITESLTKIRVSKLNGARDFYNRNNVWTYDGRIMVKDENNRISVYYD